MNGINNLESLIFSFGVDFNSLVKTTLFDDGAIFKRDIFLRFWYDRSMLKIYIKKMSLTSHSEAFMRFQRNISFRFAWK
jgi:hypothetical protein